MGLEQFQKNPAVLDQVFTDLARPQDLHQKAPMASAVVLARNQHANFLPLEISRANQPDAGGRNVPTQQLNLSVIGRQDFGGLDEWNPAVLPALHVGGI